MIVKGNLTAVQLKHYLNENHTKKNGAGFEFSDIQGYIRRGRTPKWVGNYLIKPVRLIPGVKLYNLIQLK